MGVVRCDTVNIVDHFFQSPLMSPGTLNSFGLGPTPNPVMPPSNASLYPSTPGPGGPMTPMTPATPASEGSSGITPTLQ